MDNNANKLNMTVRSASWYVWHVVKGTVNTCYAAHAIKHCVAFTAVSVMVMWRSSYYCSSYPGHLQPWLSYQPSLIYIAARLYQQLPQRFCQMLSATCSDLPQVGQGTGNLCHNQTLRWLLYNLYIPLYASLSRLAAAFWFLRSGQKAGRGGRRCWQ